MKYLGPVGPHGSHECDYWAVEHLTPPPGSSLAGEMLGHYYALLTAKYLDECNKLDRPGILPRIMAAIIRKGKFWGKVKDGEHDGNHDDIAIGFASGIGSILGAAHSHGTVRIMAASYARHYASHAKQAKGGIRKVLEQRSKMYQEFAEGRSTSGQEVRS